MTTPPLCAAPLPQAKPPKHEIPPGACDCHFHVFAPPSPQIPERSYTAPLALLSAYQNLQETLGLDRAVIVQPSIYGTDNRTTLQSLPSDGSMKAIVVVDAKTPSATLQGMSQQGAVGARANLLFSSNADLTDLKALTAPMAELGWHLQVLADVSKLPDLSTLIATLPVPVVFDHMGHVPAKDALNTDGFRALLHLLETGQVWVKLSGAYRVAPDDMAQAAPMAEALIAANPERLVWGSDWPHPAIKSAMPDDGTLLDLLFDWAGPDVARQILVENPEKLYGFEKWSASDAK